jgi:hypothetical protein
MVPGFNSSATRAGLEYHVQSEDLGLKNPHILTLVYLGGAIVHREKTSYREALGAGTTTPRIRAFMEEQHRRIMAQVASGAIPPAATPPAPPQAGTLPQAVAKLADDLIAAYLASRRTAPSR